MIKGLVSVVIPTCKNEEGKLNPIDKCLVSIGYSTYDSIEIICVDEGLERSAQRNAGIRDARGEFILYLDDDQYISSGLIKECVDLMDIYPYEALYIPEIIVTQNWFGRLRNWERGFYTGTPVDCIRFFKAEGCPMFDEAMNGPEDADFNHQFGWKGITDNPLYHDDNIGVVQYLKKKNFYAKSMERYKDKWPKDKVLNWKWRCFGVFFEHGKYKRVLRRPDLMILIWCLMFIRGIIYLKNIYLTNQRGFGKI